MLQDYTSLDNLTYLKTTYSWSLSPITVSANKKELYKMQTKQDCKVQALPVPMIWSSEHHGERERWGHITSCNKSSAPNKFAVDRILFSFRGSRPQYDRIFVKLLLQHSRTGGASIALRSGCSDHAWFSFSPGRTGHGAQLCSRWDGLAAAGVEPVKDAWTQRHWLVLQACACVMSACEWVGVRWTWR